MYSESTIIISMTKKKFTHKKFLDLNSKNIVLKKCFILSISYRYLMISKVFHFFFFSISIQKGFKKPLNNDLNREKEPPCEKSEFLEKKLRIKPTHSL